MSNPIILTDKIEIIGELITITEQVVKLSKRVKRLDNIQYGTKNRLQIVSSDLIDIIQEFNSIDLTKSVGGVADNN